MANNTAKYNQDIYQLDRLILDVYNAVYAKNGKYKIKYIDVSDLKIQRFKAFDYDLDIIFDATDVEYVGTYPTGMENVSQFYFKRRGEIHKSMIRIIPYSKIDELDNMADPVNVNQIIKTLLSELVVGEKSNNLILPIVNVDVKGDDLMRFEMLKSFIDPKKYYSIEITEKYYVLTNLDNFLKDYALDANVFKYIIYQAVDVLYQISTLYPGFRYNQFFPDMVDCYIKKIDDTFYPEIKLSNYFLSEIEEIVPNDYLKNDNIPAFRTTYGDLYQILNYLWNNLYNDIKKYPEIVKIFDKILPEKIRSGVKYLTMDLWNTLTEDEKEDLKIKNIRNMEFFAKYSIPKNGFINAEPNEPSVGGSDFSEDIISEKYVDLSTEIASDNDNNTDIHQVFSANKKYYNNDIDNMPNKNSNNNSRKNIKNNETTDDYTDFELTEDISELKNIRPAKIVDVSETRKTSKRDNHSRDSEKPGNRSSNTRENSNYDMSRNKNPVKSYHGTRQIANLNNNNNNNNDLKYLLNNTQPNNNNLLLNNNNNMLPNNSQSRINSIGSMLGINPSDINPSNGNNLNYAQMIQQMQPSGPDMNYQLPSMIPPNQVSPVPSQIQNPYSQIPMGGQSQIDNDTLMRYITATNQLSGQNINNQAMLPQTNNNGIDQNMLAALLMQQQQKQMPQQALNLPMQYQMNGGGKPFFFQQ